MTAWEAAIYNSEIAIVSCRGELYRDLLKIFTFVSLLTAPQTTSDGGYPLPLWLQHNLSTSLVPIVQHSSTDPRTHLALPIQDPGKRPTIPNQRQRTHSQKSTANRYPSSSASQRTHSKLVCWRIVIESSKQSSSGEDHLLQQTRATGRMTAKTGGQESFGFC
jgi:hypothetical protein